MAGTKITILYGSETGTAHDIAEQIWKRSKRTGLKSSVDAMDEYNIRNLINEQMMIFVVSTAGQGDTPLNMKQFWKCLLRKSLPVDFLSNLKFSVLGLGDSSFEKFNFAAKKLNKRLIQLGATELVPIGLADDQHDLGIDAVFSPWLEDVFNNVCHEFNVPKGSILSEHEIIERFRVDIIRDQKPDNSITDIYLYEAEKNKTLITSTIIENIRTTASDHFQDVRLIKFKVPEVDYSPGDIVYIKAKNSDEQVDKFFDVLNKNGVDVHPDMLIQVSEKEIKLPTVLEPKLTLKQIVQQYWDLNNKPKRSTLHTLSLISENELEKEKLIEFITAAGQEDLFNYINRPRRNIIEVLNDFPHTTNKLNVKLLFEIMTPVKPRAFSIASSSKQTKNEVHLLVAVVRYKTKLVDTRYGLCSNWLATLKSNEKAVFWIQKGTFKFDYEKPMILVGPGTGIAPFRSLLLDKAAKDGDLSSCLVFFGCRNEKKDYHCEDDFRLLTAKYGLKLFCAFSRDQPDKIYVQHLIRQQKELCWSFLQNSGNIYLAGTEPVRLSPGWEGTGRPDDELNFKGVTMDQADLELNPPRDRLNIVWLIMILHGIGALTSWNMFITAKGYFVDYKLSKDYTNEDLYYSQSFLSYMTLFSQIPNLLFNWMNIFLPLGGNLTTRIVWGLFIQVIVFIITIILAMMDTSKWPGIFAIATLISVVVLNTANGIYQNSVFGLAAKLPGKYTGAVVLGSNISGTFTAVISLCAKYFAPNVRTSAIYYFITALFVLLACFDTYFALPINRFYRYHEYLNQKEANKKKLEYSSNRSGSSKFRELWEAFKQCWPQCFNVWFVFFVTLSLFPNLQVNIKRSDPNFIVPEAYYDNIMCFLSFNITAMLGSSLASWFQWPSKRFVIIPILLRAAFIPLYFVCKYVPDKITADQRSFILIENDWIYLVIGLLMGLTSGYFSSVAMMYCSNTVEPRHASNAGMFGAAFLITGILSGIGFSMLMPWFVSIIG
ncbi:NADPH-dependent diflavin oxidoreductase 1 isoform X8 [Nasonia vitripennis]|uniref:NADPH-dependent diflavin oxidoreductase 1 n=1 Tax=Nasonia vitripennis TaxID=7425 RepID=A0A7M7TAC2_NASVI|nr:NADPH-dependent diflavin oxidoreductase 1 isoform X8 [Nasonia vitripennis]